MRAWFRNLRRPTGKLQLRQQAPTRLPRVEVLEDRCLLQGGPLTNEGFVTQLYRDVLKRQPDQGGLTAWTGLLDSGQGQASRPQQASASTAKAPGSRAPSGAVRCGDRGTRTTADPAVASRTSTPRVW